MQLNDCYYLGVVTKKFSYKGELLLKLDTDDPELYTQLEIVFLHINEQLIPYEILGCKLHKTHFLRVAFTEINTEEEAEFLLGKEVYLPLHHLPKLEGKSFYYHEVIGFQIKDQNGKILGEISRINDQTAQALFIINDQTHQHLIPIVDEFIQSIDRKQKIIHMVLPDGITEINK